MKSRLSIILTSFIFCLSSCEEKNSVERQLLIKELQSDIEVLRFQNAYSRDYLNHLSLDQPYMYQKSSELAISIDKMIDSVSSSSEKLITIKKVNSHYSDSFKSLLAIDKEGILSYIEYKPEKVNDIELLRLYRIKEFETINAEILDVLEDPHKTVDQYETYLFLKRKFE